MVADAKAIQYILHTSGYRYPKARATREPAIRFVGKGMFWAEGIYYHFIIRLRVTQFNYRSSGQAHQRQRKAMNPAFSTSQLKQYLTLFQRSVDKVENDLPLFIVYWFSPVFPAHGEVGTCHQGQDRRRISVRLDAVDSQSHLGYYWRR
jgi:cytochrome P450